MEPGGESTQYESIRTVTTTPPKDKGQLGATQKNTISELRILSEDKKDNDQDENEGDVAKDPNLMSAQTAGETGGITGEVNKDLKPDQENINEQARQSRTAQKLGPGTGIGA